MVAIRREYYRSIQNEALKFLVRLSPLLFYIFMLASITCYFFFSILLLLCFSSPFEWKFKAARLKIYSERMEDQKHARSC